MIYATSRGSTSESWFRVESRPAWRFAIGLQVYEYRRQGDAGNRIRTEDAHRIFYVAKFEEAIYVLHAFPKKTQQTSRKDIALGQQRYKEMLQLCKQQARETS